MSASERPTPTEPDFLEPADALPDRYRDAAHDDGMYVYDNQEPHAWIWSDTAVDPQEEA